MSSKRPIKMEHQNTEYKQSWRDEYIKWICGFANANGGVIYIGIDDKGNVTGVDNAKKLLEDIPNKTRDVLGLLADVNLKTKSKKNYLEIIVEPNQYPVSFRSQYFYRTGSTNQELKGAALDRFILSKQGLRWDSVPQPKLKVRELSKIAFDYFKKQAANTKRIEPEFLKVKTDLLLAKLHLKTEAGYLKRATTLLFHHDPEKFTTGAYVKIGFFNSDDDLVYMDEIHGYLFVQVEKTMELLLTKYLQAKISYRGIHRIEEFPVPEPALREAVINAIVHKDYVSGNLVQISVYDNKLIIWNSGVLPENWTVERLKTKHPSLPFNPDIANSFFRAGVIEAWGRGTIKIINECKKAKAEVPVFSYDLSGFIIEFNYEINRQTNAVAAKTKTKNVSNTDKVLELIRGQENITIIDLATWLNVSDTTIKRILKELQETKRITREGGYKHGKWIVASKK